MKDAAIGMGFDARALFLSVELPLALPALISGLRVVAIQAIGLAAVAALIGAGGLGVFVFQGIGQYALELVLLGAIPIILLALAADFLFQMLLAAARRSAPVRGTVGIVRAALMGANGEEHDRVAPCVKVFLAPRQRSKIFRCALRPAPFSSLSDPPAAASRRYCA